MNHASHLMNSKAGSPRLPGRLFAGQTLSRRRGQRGAFMLEVSLAIVISALAAVGAIRESIKANRMLAANAQADALNIYAHALQTYSEENYLQLQNGQPVTKGAVTLNPGNALGQTMQPDVPNLILMGYLPAGFQNQVMFVDGAQYANQIQLEPLGCVPAACNIRGFAYIDQPLRVRGSVETDGLLIGQMLQRIGGNAGTSVEGSVATISSVGGAWNWVNPVAGQPAGVVGARFGYDSAAFGNFVRINDTRDPNLQGNLSVAQNVGVGANLTVTGTTTLNGATTINAPTTINENLTVRDAANNPCVTLDRAGVVTINCAGTLNANTGVFTDGVGNTTTIGPNGVVATGRVRGSQGLATNTAQLFDTADPNAIVVNAGQMFLRSTVSGTLVSFDSGDVIAARNVAGRRLAVSEIVAEGAGCANTSSALAGPVTEFATMATGGLATCQGGRWTAVSRTSTAGAACAQAGAQATDATDGQGLICRGGVYVRTGTLLSNFVLAGTAAASDGTVIAKPACSASGGLPSQPLIILTPSNEDPPIVGGVTVSGINRYAVDNGASWTAHLQRASDGSALPGTMIASLYCWYP